MGSYIIVRALSCERPHIFEIRPSLPHRQGLTPPLPLWRGLWPSRIGTAWASALSSLPAADTRVTSWEKRRSAGDTWAGDSEGGGEYMARSQPIVYTLSHSVTHSVTTSHTPPPSLLVHLLYSNSLTQFFTLFVLHAPVFRHVSLLSTFTQQLSNRHCSLSSTRSSM